jgi:hypothetical protein
MQLPGKGGKRLPVQEVRFCVNFVILLLWMRTHRLIAFNPAALYRQVAANQAANGIKIQLFIRNRRLK